MSKNKSLYNQGSLFLLNNNKVHENQIYNENRLFNHYSNLALNRFRWENLPNGLESRHIESALFMQGQAFFYKDKVKGLTCLPCSPLGLNFLGDPTHVNVTGVDFTENLPVEEGIRILENDMQVAPVFHLMHYVDLMNETEQTIFMNLGQQRFPFIVPTSVENELTVKNLFGKIGNFVKTIFTDKNMSDNINGKEGIRVLQTGVPYLLDKLQDFKHDYEAELFTYLGLNNANTDKKERMVVDEVNVNNGQILMSLDIGYKNRLKACELINKKFGLNVKVIKVIDEIENNLFGGEEDVSELDTRGERNNND